MLSIKRSFSGFSVTDLAKTQDFYANILELKTTDTGMGLKIMMPGGYDVFAYAKKDHQPATFTILNFEVEDIDATVEELDKRGVKFEQYGGDIKTDEKGIMRGIAANRGPDIAWFKDPSGNILSVLQDGLAK